MRWTPKRLTWMLIASIAMYDCYFAAKHDSLFLQYEINPLARFVFAHCGLVATILFRLALIAFAAWASKQPVKLAMCVTPIWGLAHAYLFVVYFVLIIVGIPAY